MPGTTGSRAYLTALATMVLAVEFPAIAGGMVVTADEMDSLFGRQNVRRVDASELPRVESGAIQNSFRFLAEVGLPREVGSFASTDVRHFTSSGDSYYRIGSYDGQSVLCLEDATANIVDLVFEKGSVISKVYVNGSLEQFVAFLCQVQRATLMVHRYYEGSGPRLDQSAFLARLKAVDDKAMLEGAWWQVLLEDMLLSAE
ncbi:SUKH-4 family immunity protein [Micromonospora sp. A3M-1-15]|uniref:SUKH-4 family immunity protein n=1 Tax=Micromonospora sp. A3M-1-15 TaxID=2962035 RepID=UPI0020B7C131|nr:SUKH-4 family immunity protein [Micromonospora sp. A3M-1-15]MCP3786851.1 SUKH-4 family immunity protein [Micromonospora sp. A3M-1-15]